jgi:proline iminopeptidase
VESGGARLYVRELGAGHPIIVLHGGPDFDQQYLLPDLDRLADLGRLVYYDQRGRGRSYAGEGPDDVDMTGEMDDLDRVREWSRSASVALLGHSWGTLLALEYAIRNPERVSHLILLNPAPASHADGQAFRGYLAATRGTDGRARMAAIAASPAYLAGDVDADVAYYRIHFAAGVSRPENLDEIIRRLRYGSTPEGIVAARAIEERLYDVTWRREDYNLLPHLRQLRIPTLVMHGDHDLIPLDAARHIAAAIPDSRLVVITECGHFSFLEQPDPVHAAVAELIAPY